MPWCLCRYTYGLCNELVGPQKVSLVAQELRSTPSLSAPIIGVTEAGAPSARASALRTASRGSSSLLKRLLQVKAFSCNSSTVTERWASCWSSQTHAEVLWFRQIYQFGGSRSLPLLHFEGGLFLLAPGTHVCFIHQEPTSSGTLLNLLCCQGHFSFKQSWVPHSHAQRCFTKMPKNASGTESAPVDIFH